MTTYEVIRFYADGRVDKEQAALAGVPGDRQQLVAAVDGRLHGEAEAGLVAVLAHGGQVEEVTQPGGTAIATEAAGGPPWKEALAPLAEVDWTKENPPEWQGICMIGPTWLPVARPARPRSTCSGWKCGLGPRPRAQLATSRPAKAAPPARKTNTRRGASAS